VPKQLANVTHKSGTTAGQVAVILVTQLQSSAVAELLKTEDDAISAKNALTNAS
jgi:hypothetical protein